MRLSFKVKLGATFGVVLLIAGAVGVLAVRDMSLFNIAINDLIDGPAQRVQLGERIETAFVSLALAEKNMILADTDQNMDRFEAEIFALRKTIDGLTDKLRAVSDDAGRQRIDAFSQSIAAFIAVQDKVRALTRRNTENVSREMSQTTVQRAFEQLETALRGLVDRPPVEQAGAVTLAKDTLIAGLRFQRLEKDIVLATDEALPQYIGKVAATRSDFIRLRDDLVQSLPPTGALCGR